jgi:hypothetical protein
MMEGSAGPNAHLLIENLAALLPLRHGPVPSCIGIPRNREWISVLLLAAEERLRGSHIPSLAEKAVRALAVLIVVPGNSDLADTLGVEPHPFLHPSFYFDGHSGSPTTLNQGWAARLGIPNVGPQTFPGFAGLGSFSVTPGGYSRTLNEDFTFQDNMTKIAGRHTFKWDYEFIRTRENDVAATTPSGTYTFSTAGTALPFTPNTGNSFASFLLGAVTSASFTELLANYLPRWWSQALHSGRLQGSASSHPEHWSALQL